MYVCVYILHIICIYNMYVYVGLGKGESESETEGRDWEGGSRSVCNTDKWEEFRV